MPQGVEVQVLSWAPKTVKPALRQVFYLVLCVAFFCYYIYMTLYTGKGDKGTTKLFDSPQGERVSKAGLMFEVLGTLDELNTCIGWCKVAAADLLIDDQSGISILREVQDHIFTIQAEVAGAQKTISETSISDIEGIINAVELELPEITTFLIPGGNELSARLDMARALSRRVERRLVALNEEGKRALSEHSLKYSNRLSSLLYALVRIVNHRGNIDESAPSYK